MAYLHSQLQEELGVAQSEKELLEQRLSIEKERSSETRDTLLKQIDRETRTVKDQYIGIIADHERRIADLNESHVEQCEHLCREVVDSNQEIMRLQKVIAHLAVPGTLDRNINTNVAMSATRKSRSRTVPRMMAALMVFVVGLLLGNQCHNFSQVIESDAVVKSLGAFLQSFSLFATTEGPPILEDEEELPSPQDTPVATTRANHLMEVLEYTLE